MIQTLTAKDFETNQGVRWCPGCGDYAILKQMRTVLAERGIPKENIVFISGIGCSSRFPYYVDTYGMHSIHGRAAAIATGLKLTRPDLSVWVITGDGDCLSIGGNHFIHMLRRNPNLNVLMFNNRIYGLTKGQYSPTSEVNKITKSSPLGSIDYPLNVAMLAMGSRASFIARSVDTEVKHLQEMLRRVEQHQGASFLEIYQNCNIFNDGTFYKHKDKKTKQTHNLILKQGQPLVFGEREQQGIRLDGFLPRIVSLGTDFSKEDLWIHDEQDYQKALLLSQFVDIVDETSLYKLPTPLGVLFAQERATYQAEVKKQIHRRKEKTGEGNIDLLIGGTQTWTVH